MKVKLAVAVVLIVLLTTGFFGLDYILLAQHRYYDISVALDSWIPLSPVWIWAYLLYYPFCLIPLLLPPVLKDTRLFARVCAGFLIQFFVAWPIFYFFPTRIVHPALSGTTPSILAVQGLYQVDAGYCIFPCLHVANSLYVALVLRRFLPARWGAPIYLIVVLITASTLLIKQHLFLDVLAGILLGLAAHAFFLGTARFWAGASSEYDAAEPEPCS
jgi:membrane-associated phospholipid phosphatase